jgi:hypothetical protein
MTSKNFDSDSAMANPRIRYQTPEAVLEDKHLNRAQKIQVLEAWERDERELAVATEEGMVGGDSDLLQRIRRTLDAIGGGAESGAGGSTKHGI